MTGKEFRYQLVSLAKILAEYTHDRVWFVTDETGLVTAHFANALYATQALPNIDDMVVGDLDLNAHAIMMAALLNNKRRYG